MSIIEIDHLKKYYGKHRGVEDVTFDVREGEIFGFIGPNGAGKSTTLRCALSLIYPTSGKIRIFGKDAVADRVEIAREVGYLPGEVFYYDNMTVKGLLDYSAAFYPNVKSQTITDLCELMELDPGKRIEDLAKLPSDREVWLEYGDVVRNTADNRRLPTILHRLQIAAQSPVMDAPEEAVEKLTKRFQLTKEEGE